MYRAVLLVIVSSAILNAGETRVKMQDLPKAVQKTVREEITNAKLRGLTKEIENGQTFYEAETVVNGTTRDILIDTHGVVVEVEQATTLANIPQAAQKALKEAAGSARILGVERVTKGSVVSYEAVFEKAGKKSEIAVNGDGTARK